MSTAVVTCIDCKQTRTIKRGSAKLPQRCDSCQRQYRSTNRNLKVFSKPPKGGFQEVSRNDLACREYPDVIGHYEAVLEPAHAGWKKHLADARIDAEEICRGCPLTMTCRQAARAEYYTGIAGGKVWRRGVEVN